MVLRLQFLHFPTEAQALPPEEAKLEKVGLTPKVEWTWWFQFSIIIKMMLHEDKWESWWVLETVVGEKVTENDSKIIPMPITCLAQRYKG